MPTNRGRARARRTGTAAAVGRVVVWTDADMTYPNDEIPDLVKAMDGYDQVVGARRTEEGTVKFFRVPAEVVHPLAGQLPGRRSRSPTLTRACGRSAGTSACSTCTSSRRASRA